MSGAGQKPRLTKKREEYYRQFWKQFVPVSLPLESLRSEADQASANRAASSSSLGSVFERCDEQATKRLEQEFLGGDKYDANDPSADLAFWLEDIQDHLVDTELPTGIRLGTSCESGNKRGSTIFKLTFRKTELATSA